MTDLTTTTPAPLTADERARHRPCSEHGPDACVCLWCGDYWPCEVARLLLTVDAAEQRATATLEAARAMSMICDRHTEEGAETEERLEAALAAERAARERAERWAALWKRAATIYRTDRNAYHAACRDLAARAGLAMSERDALAREVGALRKALPDPAKLWMLADWIDAKYPNDSNPEVQSDLRAWARAIYAADTERWQGILMPAVLTDDGAALAADPAPVEDTA